LADIEKCKSSPSSSEEKNIFEKIVHLNILPPPPREVLTKSDGVTIDDEAIVWNMTQFRSKHQKEGTIDVYWLVTNTQKSNSIT
jgi:hypothetical protein